MVDMWDFWKNYKKHFKQSLFGILLSFLMKLFLTTHGVFTIPLCILKAAAETSSNVIFWGRSLSHIGSNSVVWNTMFCFNYLLLLTHRWTKHLSTELYRSAASPAHEWSSLPPGNPFHPIIIAILVFAFGFVRVAEKALGVEGILLGTDRCDNPRVNVQNEWRNSFLSIPT